MADAQLVADIKIDVETVGSNDSAKKIEKLGTALQKAGMSATHFTDIMSKMATQPNTLGKLSEEAFALYKQLYETVRGFGLSKAAASRYSRELASVYDAAYKMLQILKLSEEESRRAAEQLVELTSQETRFTERVNGASVALDGKIVKLQQLIREENVAAKASLHTGNAEMTEARNTAESGTQHERTREKVIAHTASEVNLSKVLQSVGRVVNGLGLSLAALARHVHLNNLSIRTLNNNFRRFYSTLRAVTFTALIFGGALKKWFELSAEFAETNHLLISSLSHVSGAIKTEAVSVSELTDETQKYAVVLTDVLDQPLDTALVYESEEIAARVRDALDSLKSYSYKMMLDPTALRQMYGSFIGMADAAGIASDQAIELSSNMTRLAVDLASLWDIDFEDAATKLRSALAGNTRAARALGIDVGRSAAAAWLAEKGYTASYESLSLADRMLVQYAVAMKGAATAQGDLARSALQPANMFRFLAESARKAARALGNALFPVFTAFLPLIIMTVDALTALANRLSMFFSKKMGKIYDDAAEQWRSYANNLNFLGTRGDDELEDLNDEIEQSAKGLGNAAGAAKEFKKQLLGFDEINNLTENNDNIGGGLGGLGGISILDPDDLKFDYTFQSILGDVRSQLEDAANNIRDWLSDTFGDSFISVFRDQHFGEFFGGLLRRSWDIIVRIFGDMKTLFFGETPEDYERSFKKLKSLITTIFDGVVGVVLNIKQAIERIADETDISWDDVIGFVRGFSNGVQEIIAILTDIFIDLYNGFKTILNTFGVTNAEDFGEFTAKMMLVVGVLDVLKPLFSSLSSFLGVFSLGKLLKLGGGTVAGEAAAGGAAAGGAAAAGGITAGPIIGASILGLLGSYAATKSMMNSLDNFKHFDGTPYTEQDKMAYMTSSNTGMLTLPAGTTGEDIAKDLVGTGEKIREWWDGIVQVFKDKTQATKDSWQDFLSFLNRDSKSTWIEMMEHPESYALSMKGAFASVETTANNHLTTISTVNDNIGTSVNNLAQKFSEKAQESVTTAQTTTDEIASTFQKYIDNNTLASQMINVGRNFIEGFKIGVNEKARNLNSWFNSSFGGMINSIKSKLEIHSPSKVMEKIGSYFMEGFGVGVAEETPAVMNSLMQFAENATNALQAGSLDVSSLTANQFADVTDTIGSSINAQATATLQTQNNDVIGTMQMEIGLLREQNNLLSQILGKDVSVSLDGKQIAASINQASRIQGRPLIYA